MDTQRKKQYVVISDKGAKPGPADCGMRNREPKTTIYILSDSEGQSIEMKVNDILVELSKTRIDPSVVTLCDDLVNAAFWRKNNV